MSSREEAIQAGIQCPFFHALNSRSIICESLVRGAYSMSIRFRYQSGQYSHILWHCNERDGGGCPLYEALQRKYAEKKDARQDG